MVINALRIRTAVDTFSHYFTVFKFDGDPCYYSGVLIIENMKAGRQIIYDIDRVSRDEKSRINHRLRKIASSARYRGSKNTLTPFDANVNTYLSS